MNPVKSDVVEHDAAIDAIVACAWRDHCAGRLDEAERQYRQALSLAPGHAEAMHFLGLLAHQRGQSDEGIRLVRQSIALEAGRGDWHNNLGNMLAAAQRHDEAAEAFLAALEINPRNAVVWNNLGAVLQHNGHLEDATVAFGNAIVLDPGFEDALNNLGQVQAARGLSLEAARSYCHAYVLDAHSAKPRHMLGIAYYILGRIDEAAQIYRQWLQEEPDNPIARHHLASCTGQDVPERASDAFLEAHFDYAATDFDNKLVVSLGYRIPELTGQVLTHLGVANASLRVLDAGCGTGLCGPYLAPFAKKLVGVDLSGKSLALAAQKVVYDELVKAEIVAYLSDKSQAFDLLVAADTFIYFGVLDRLLQAAAQALSHDGLLIASAEALAAENADYVLNPSGRYSHGRVYLEAAMVAAGFELLLIEPVEIRVELGQSVRGWLLVARLAASAAGPR